MVKSRFLTKYTLPKRVLRHYDREDNVDRLSYCDTTTSILRFMKAGRDLRMSRSQAMYRSLEELKTTDNGTEVPVYPEDPVELSNRIEVVKKALESRLSEKSVEREHSESVSDVQKSDSAEPREVINSSPFDNGSAGEE